MRLYIGSTQQFIRDTVHNQIADRLKAAFFNYYRYTPSPAEIRSWRQSLAVELTSIGYTWSPALSRKRS